MLYGVTGTRIITPERDKKMIPVLPVPLPVPTPDIMKNYDGVTDNRISTPEKDKK